MRHLTTGAVIAALAIALTLVITMAGVAYRLGGLSEKVADLENEVMLLRKDVGTLLRAKAVAAR